MGGTCKEWFVDVGCKSTLDKEQYTHLVWCAALASKVENFTSYNKQSTPNYLCKCGHWLSTIEYNSGKCPSCRKLLR